MCHYPQTTHVALTKRRQADINGMNYYCLFLSLECCPYRYEGKYLCTLPMNAALLPDNSKGCFAQEKFSDYCTDTTNPAMGIAKNDDRRPAVLVMTDDCRVGQQIHW